MKNLMQRYKVAHFVVGTPFSRPKRITPRFSGAVVLIDTGMVFPGGVASALEIRDGQFTAIYPEEADAPLRGGQSRACRALGGHRSRL